MTDCRTATADHRAANAGRLAAHAGSVNDAGELQIANCKLQFAIPPLFALLVSSLPAQDPPAAQPAPQEQALRRLDELQVPTVDELLIGAPRDWVVLKNNDVVVCVPIVPRPDTIAKQQKAIEDKMKERRGLMGADLERINREIEALGYLNITLPGETENPEYRVELRRVERIVHHEDLMLQRIALLLGERDLEPAYELLFRLERNTPNWPGLEARHNELLFADAGLRVAAGDSQLALAILTGLHRRSPTYAGLSQRIGEIFDRLVAGALVKQDYRQARHFLLRLDEMYKDHPVYQQHAASMAQQAQTILASAAEARAAGRHADAAALADQAAALWPRTPNLQPAFKPLAERYQRLRVGVIDGPQDPTSSPFVTSAQWRAERLAHAPLFELDRARGATIYYKTRYFDEWEPYDLGRTMHFRLRQARQPWEAFPGLDAPAAAGLLVDRIDPASPRHDERLAAYVDSIDVESPDSFSVHLARVPPRLEALLAGIVPGPNGADLHLVTTDGAEAPAPAGAFLPVESPQDQIVYRRVLPEPDRLPQYHVAEVIERRYASHEKALQGLREGEVSLLPDLPDWIVRRLQADDEFLKAYFVQPYALPTTHVLQFNPGSQPLRNRELRRALAYSLDRDRVLRETMLRDAQATHGRLVEGPFSSKSFANSLAVTRREYDLNSAVALSFAAARQLGGEIPTLRMSTTNGPVEQEVARQLIRAWKRVRINVELVAPDAGADPRDCDIFYRALQMPEPTLEIWPFLTAQTSARVADLATFPDWLKQKLIALDRTADWGRAVTMMQDLHRLLWGDVYCIPLWEVDEFLVVRKNIRGFPPAPVHCYHNVDRWTVEAWYPTN